MGCHFLLQCMKVKSEKLLSCVRLLATPWTPAYQAPPSMGFSRQEYWSHCLLWYCSLSDYKFERALLKFEEHSVCNHYWKTCMFMKSNESLHTECSAQFLGHVQKWQLPLLQEGSDVLWRRLDRIRVMLCCSCSGAKSCLTLCDHMPDFPVLHYLPAFV